MNKEQGQEIQNLLTNNELEISAHYAEARGAIERVLLELLQTSESTGKLTTRSRALTDIDLGALNEAVREITEHLSAAAVRDDISKKLDALLYPKKKARKK